MAPILLRILEGVVDGSLSLPRGFNLSTMTFMPKAIPVGLAETSSTDVVGLRPLTLTSTGPKILALSVNGKLAALAATTVMSQQRGFVVGRSLGDYLYELEATMISYSGWRQRLAAAIFFDFRTAFPSLSRCWLIRVLRGMHVPCGVVRAVEEMCDNCDSMLLFRGEIVGDMAITSGIKQGCPMSGSLFALSVDPFLRSTLVSSLVGLIRLEAYADDLAVVLSRFWDDVASIMTLFGRWRLAASLSLNPSKCVLVPLWSYTTVGISTRLEEVCPALSGSSRCRGVLGTSG